MDVEHIVRDIEDHNLREELRSCQHFLVESELEKARHKVFNYAVETLIEKNMNEKLDHFFKFLKCAAKVNLAIWFHFENYRRWRIQLFLRMRKQYPAGSIETCVHP